MRGRCRLEPVNVQGGDPRLDGAGEDVLVGGAGQVEDGAEVGELRAGQAQDWVEQGWVDAARVPRRQQAARDRESHARCRHEDDASAIG